jgi:hypothetical protein
MKKLIYLFLATAFFVSCGGSGLKDKLCDCLDEASSLYGGDTDRAAECAQIAIDAAEKGYTMYDCN